MVTQPTAQCRHEQRSPIDVLGYSRDLVLTPTPVDFLQRCNVCIRQNSSDPGQIPCAVGSFCTVNIERGDTKPTGVDGCIDLARCL